MTLADGGVLVVKLAADGSTRPLLATGDKRDDRTLSKLGLPAASSPGANFAVQGTWKTQPGVVTASNDTALLFSPDGSAWQVFAQEGAPAPGADGATFASFFEPMVNANRKIAFLSNLQGAGVTGASTKGLWSGAPEAPQLVARLGSLAPDASGAPSATTWSAISSYALPTSPDAGRSSSRGRSTEPGIRAYRYTVADFFSASEAFPVSCLV